MLSLAGVFLVVMMSFKSAVMPILVIIPIEVAIFINMAMPYFQGVEMVYMGYIIVSSIQLGATVDYSILLANNYLAKRKTLPKKKACVEAIAASCSSIFTSGSIITLAGYIVYMISSNGDRRPWPPDRTRRTVQPCAGTDGASAAVNII